MARQPNSKAAGPALMRAIMSGETLPEPASLRQVAALIGVSPRTLQRQLQRERMQFRCLVEDSRFRTAAALLSGSETSIADIARRLGYSTPSGFSRAFAKWAGCTPRAFRRSSRAGTDLAQNGQNSDGGGVGSTSM